MPPSGCAPNMRRRERERRLEKPVFQIKSPKEEDRVGVLRIMRTRHFTSILLLGLVASIVACRKRTQSSSASGAPAAVAALPGTDSRPLSPAHRESTAELGEKTAQKLSNGQPDPIARDLNLDPILEAAFVGVDWDSNPKWKELRDTLVRRVRADPAQLLANLKGTHAKFLRLRETSSGTAALVRCVMPGGACTYFDIYPRFESDGSAHIGNIYNHATGLSVPEALRSILLTLAPAPDQTLIERLFAHAGKTDPAVLEEFDTALRSRSPAGVAAVWPKFPTSFRAQRPILMSALQVLMLEPESPAYLSLLEEARRQYTDEPLADFLSIDFYFLKKDRAGLEACLERIIERLGGPDANLITLRANGQLQAGDFTAALASLDEAFALEPDFEGAHFARLQALIAQRDFPAAVAQLDSLTERFNRPFPPSSARESAAMTAFLASPEFAKWRASHPLPPTK
jgi:Tetratricopeptide repeat